MARGRVMSDCNCPLGADECDDEHGIFLPLQPGGRCAVRPCQKRQYVPPTRERLPTWDGYSTPGDQYYD